MGISQQIFVLMSLVTLTFELWARYFYNVYLTAKFDRPTFSRSDVIVRTNYTNWQTHTLTNRRRWKHPPRFA